MLCTYFGKGRKHDFNLFKESNLQIRKDKQIIVDTWYTWITKIHKNSLVPKKSSKKSRLTKEKRLYNKQLSSDRISNENVIWKIKIFKIISDRYRNRRKRFALRFNLIAWFYNFELDA